MTKPITVKNLVLGQGMPKICVPLTGADREALLEEAKEAKAAGAELVEWRADFYEQLFEEECVRKLLGELSDILGQIPLIFTLRTKKEGGNCQIRTEDYVNCLLAAAKSGCADLVDVEAFGEEAAKKELIAELHKSGVFVVASSHDFEKTEDREALLARFCQLDETGADILKMAVMPHTFDDTAALMQATAEMTKRTHRPLVSMAMGNLGSMSRIAGENFGSAITFATVGAASAPGQFPIKELRMMMKALHGKNCK